HRRSGPGVSRRRVRPSVGGDRTGDDGTRPACPDRGTARHRPRAGLDGRRSNRPHRKLARRAIMIDAPRFVPRPPWIGGDLQTLRNYLRPPGDILAPWPGEELRFTMKDGTGDELVGTLHRPA